MHCERTDSSRFYIPWRLIYDFEMYFVVSGVMRVVLEDTYYDLTAGDLHFMKPFQFHKRVVPEGQTCIYYSIHFDFINTGEETDFDPNEYKDPCDFKLPNAPINPKLLARVVFEPSEFSLPSKMNTAEPEKYLTLLQEMLHTFGEKPFGYVLTLKSDLLKILNFTATQLFDRENPIKSPTIKAAKDLVICICQYIDENYNKPISLTNLSKNFGISTAYLRKIFQTHKHISPLNYIVDLRIERAKKLLLKRQYTVNEICSLLGINDAPTFCRMFKNKTGVSPLQYVKNIVGGA
jgi:AraC-like DNA-binding protein